MSRRACLVVVCILTLLLTACVPQAEVEAGVTALPTSEAATPMAAVDVLLPAAEPTAAPPAPTLPLWTPCEDDGHSGVGTVRGNTNPNLNMGVRNGVAVACGGNIYYAGNYPDDAGTYRLLCHTIATGETVCLWQVSETESGLWGHNPILDINVLDDTLYFVQAVEKTDCLIRRLPLSGGQPETIMQGKKLVVAYGKLFVQTDTGTIIADCADPSQSAEIEDFAYTGVMDGCLYGRFDGEEQTVRLDHHGRVNRRYRNDLYPGYVLIDGYAIGLDDLQLGFRPDGALDHTGLVRITNVETGGYYGFVVPDIPCSGYYSASSDYVYIQTYYGDECGDIWRVRWDGTGLEQADRRVFRCGFMLDDDRLLSKIVPCDEYTTDRAKYIP